MKFKSVSQKKEKEKVTEAKKFSTKNSFKKFVNKLEMNKKFFGKMLTLKFKRP